MLSAAVRPPRGQDSNRVAQHRPHAPATVASRP